jgi:isorenieratene synthase
VLEPVTTIVIGSGPAALAAALTLVRGGEPVVLLDRSADLGGKVRTMVDHGRTYEHGVHGWWPAYVNFDQLLRLSDVDPETILTPGKDIRVAVEGGRQLRLTPLSSNLPSPLSIAIQSLRVPLLTVGDVFRLSRFAVHLLAFDALRDTAGYEQLTFEALLDYCGVTEHAKQLLFAPFAKAFAYSTLEGLNAAAALSALWYYILPSDRDSVPRWLTGTSLDLVVGPIAQKITELGGIVLSGVTAEGLELTAEGVSVVVSGLDSPPPGLKVNDETSTTVGTVPKALVDEAAAGLSTTVGAIPVLVRRSADPSAPIAYEAIVRTCTHAGCETAHIGTSFVCPCHGGVFDDVGDPIAGPPTRSLSRLSVAATDSDITLSRRAPRRTIPADYVIVAADPLATRDIFAATAVSDDMHHDLGHLEASSVLVIRFWFRDVATDDKPQAVLTPLLPMVDSYFCISRIIPKLAEDLHVVEIQVAGIKSHYLDLPDTSLVALALEDLKVVSPDYRADRLVDSRVLRHRGVFSAFPVPEVPPTAPQPVPGVFIAGDWTPRPGNSWMMERAVASGVDRANQILGTDTTGSVPVLTPRPAGLLLRFCAAVAFLIRSILRGGYGVPPNLTPDQMTNHDRIDHVINGWAALGIGAAAALAALSSEFALLSKVWPVILLITNLYFFAHVEPWVRASYGSWFRALSDRHTFQHRIMTAGGTVVAGIEIALSLGWLHGALWRAMFPAGVVIFGVLFTLHHSGEDPMADRQHRDIGFLSMAIGVTVGLARFFPIAAAFNVVWGILFVIQSYFFITYTGTPVHLHGAATSSPDGHDHSSDGHDHVHT